MPARSRSPNWRHGSFPRCSTGPATRLATYEEQTHQDRRLAEEIREAAGDLVNRISHAGSTA
jgi:GrpB-like predicted nucleotidyltransferase (UPF0157 family)